MDSDDLLSDTRFAHWICGLCTQIRICALEYMNCAQDMGFVHSYTRYMISQHAYPIVLRIVIFSYFDSIYDI
jgi:hypothetical protein